MRTILITGGTGVVGKALVKQLVQKNYKVIILTRSMKDYKADDKVSYALWNVKENSIDVEAVKKADAIIHLAGAGVMDKKWDEAYKKEIEETNKLGASFFLQKPNRFSELCSALEKIINHNWGS